MMSTGEYFSFMYNHVLYDFQKEIILNILNNNKVAILGSRQLGKTYILSFAAIILACGTQSFKGRDVLIISETEEKSKKIIRDVQQHLDKMEKATGTIRQPGRGGLFDVVLSNGSMISAKPGKPTALQAYTGHTIVDEMSLTRFDTEELFGQALIVASSDESLRTVLCTNADYNGSFIHNFWYSPEDYWVNKRESWVLSNYTIWDAYPDGLPQKIKDIRASIQPKLWRKFFENSFETGYAGFFDENLILESERESLDDIDGLMVIAWDIGFTRDGSGIIVCEVSDKIKVLEEHLIFNTDIDNQIDFIKSLSEKYKAGKIVIDQGVGGVVVRQRLEKIFGASMVNGVSVTRNFYSRSSATLERLFSERKIDISPSCRELISDLHSFERDETTKSIKIPYRFIDKNKKSHCDVGVALLLATEELQHSISNNIQMQILNIDHDFGKFI